MIKDLRNKTDQELGQLISKLKTQLLQNRFDIAIGKTENSHKLKEIRKTIAMAMTVLSERKIKVSFTTLDIQLISSVDKKQKIKVVDILETVDKKTETKQAEKTNAKTVVKTPKKDVEKELNNK